MKLIPSIFHSACRVLVLTVTFCVAPSSGQILSFLPSTDSIIVVGGDYLPYMMYSVQSSTAGIDSVKVFCYLMFASIVDRAHQIPYCTFVVRDTANRHSYNVWFVSDLSGSRAPEPITLDKYSFVGAVGPGSLYLLVRLDAKPIDSMRVRCYGKLLGDVRQEHIGSPEPGALRLLQNYPNPFNGQTMITYVMTTTERVTADLYNTVGQRVRRLFEGTRSAGMHTFQLEANDLASGAYYVRLLSRQHSKTVSLIIIR